MTNLIQVPDDMPIIIKTMLEATIKSAWVDYEGDPEDPEGFWRAFSENAN